MTTNSSAMSSRVPSRPTNLGGYDCYPVSYEVHKTVPYLDPLWLAAAIVFGIIIGAILALILFRFCLRRWWERAKTKANQTAGQAEPMVDPSPSTSCAMRPSTRGEKDRARTRGMVDIALQATMEEAEAELYLQDMIASDELESDILEKRKQISEKLALIHMNQKSEGTKADREASEKVLAELRTKIAQTQSEMELDLKAQLEEMKTDPKYANNEHKLNEAIQAIKAAHRRRLHVLFKDHLNALKESLRNNTKISETDIEDMIVKLRSSLADLESHLTDLIQIQAEHVEANLAQRQFLLEQLKGNETDLDKEQKHTTDSAGKILQQLFQKEKFGEAAKEKLLQDLISALSQVREKHRSAVRLQLDQIGSKLRKERMERLEKLKQRDNEQMMKLMIQAEAMTDSAQFLQAVRDLMEQQADGTAEVKADLDKDEANKLRQAYSRVEQSWKEALQHEMEQFMNQVQEAAKLNPAEVKDILRGHEFDMREWEKMREMEKKVALSELRAKLDERKTKTQKASARKDSEQRRLTKQQDDMIQRVLEAQRDLEDGDRRQILVEHTHNQDVLSSILLLSKLRQERFLSRQLAERKLKLEKEKSAKAAAMEKKRARKSAKAAGDSQTNKNEEIEMADFSLTLEEEKEKMLQEMRDETAVETKALMAQQEKNMAALIGRLQVSQARRQMLLERQDQMVKKMETELKQQVQHLPPPDPHRLQELLIEHRRQVDNLNKALEETRQRQLHMLKERLEEKRLKTRKNLEAKFEAEEEEILTHSLKSKMSFASTLLCQNKLTTRHQRALDQLESQTKAELERQKVTLNKQMHKELERVLLEQKKQFLGQLAGLCKMTPEEIKAMSRVVQVDSHKRSGQQRDSGEHDEHGADRRMGSDSTFSQSMADNGTMTSIGHTPMEGGRLPPLARLPRADDALGETSSKRRTKKKNKRSKRQVAKDSDSD